MATRKMMGGGFFKKATGNERGWRNWAKAVFSGHASQLNSQEMKNAIRARRNNKATRRAKGRNALIGALRNKGIFVPSNGPRAGSVAAQTAAAKSVARALANGTSTTGKMRRLGFYGRVPNSNLQVGVPYSLSNNGSTRRGSPGRTAARAAPGSRQLASAARAAASMGYAPYVPTAPSSNPQFNTGYKNIGNHLMTQANRRQQAAAVAEFTRAVTRARAAPGPNFDLASHTRSMEAEHKLKQKIKTARGKAYRKTYYNVHNSSVRNGNNEVTAHRKAVNAAKLAEDEAEAALVLAGNDA